MNRWRNCSTAVSSDGQRAEIPKNARGRPSFTSVSFLADRERDSTPANANKSLVEKNPSTSWEFWWAEPKRQLESLPGTKNHPGVGDSEDESDAKIFSAPDSETGQQSSPHIQLELMRRQPQQGNADGVLQLSRIVMCKCTIEDFALFWNCLRLFTREKENWHQ